MATSSKMIQLYVEQEFDQRVQHVPVLDADAFLFMDPSSDTVVREIDSEKIGGVFVSGAPGVVACGVPSEPFVRVRLVPPRGEITEIYGPSRVASPPIPGIGLVVLRVTDIGVTTEKPGELALARAIGAHVYVDQVSP